MEKGTTLHKEKPPPHSPPHHRPCHLPKGGGGKSGSLSFPDWTAQTSAPGNRARALVMNLGEG